MSHIKTVQRRKAYEMRNAQPEKDKLSRIICKKFIQQAVYQRAETVMWYLHCRSEVRTLPALKQEMTGDKKLVIPYCTHDQDGDKKLGLWLLEDLAELEPGTWGILEPPKSRWGEVGKEITPHELDLVMVPGVAFDRLGGRLGNGVGYYDKLLGMVRPETMLIGVCYQTQLLDQVEMEPHDIYMDQIITEHEVYRNQRRKG